MIDEKFIPLFDKSGKIVGITVCSCQYYEILRKYKWRRTKSTNDFYVSATIDNKNVLMHVFVMNVLCNSPTPKGKLINNKNKKR